MRARPCLLLALALLAGCQAPVPPRVSPGAAPGLKPAASAAPGKPSAMAIGQTRVLDKAAADATGRPLVAASIIGKIRIISEHGAGAISNSGARLVSSNGASVISDNGAGIIGKIRYDLGPDGGGPRPDGGGLPPSAGGPRPYAVRQAATAVVAQAPAEVALADARIEVLDAQGRVLVDADGVPIGAISDAAGNYQLSSLLPPEGLVLRVRLDPALTPGRPGGELRAMLAPDAGRGAAGPGARELAIDTASSIGASYVLARMVQARQEVYDRLPGVEAEQLQREIEAARAGLQGAFDYRPEGLVAAAEQLRKQDGAVFRRLEKIQSILLAGQTRLGTGRLASEVSLAVPIALAGDGQGTLYVAEAGSFRIRRITPDGRIAVHAGIGAAGPAGKQSFDAIGGLTRAPDGTMYFTQRLSGRVMKLAPDGTVTELVKGGLTRPGPIAIAPDGTLYVGESPSGTPTTLNGRVQAISPTGELRPIDLTGLGAGSITGLDVATDGTLYALDSDRGQVYVQRPGQPAAIYAQHLTVGQASGLTTLGGDVYVCETTAHVVTRLKPDGTRERFAGTGAAGHGGDGGPAAAMQLNQPVALWGGPAGERFIADADGLVRRIAPDGTASTFAGTLGVTGGDALSLSINGPGGLALDQQGRLVFAETGSSLIRRLDGRTLTTVAGTFGGVGYSGDGGPATAAQLGNPAGLAARGDALYFADVVNRAIRRIDGAGVITTVVRAASHALVTGAGPFPADHAPIETVIGVALSPKGQLYWTDVTYNTIMRLGDDGRVELVAGTIKQIGVSGDGGPAREALLTAPLGIVFDPQGDLIVCDGGNLAIRKIAGGEPTGTITRVAGAPAFEGLERYVAASGKLAEEGIPALEAVLMAPTAICLDGKGGLLFTELGSMFANFGDGMIPGAALLRGLPPLGARVRRIAPDGTIHTVAGDGGKVLNDFEQDDGLINPLGMLIDGEGRLIVSDSALNQIRLVPKGLY